MSQFFEFLTVMLGCGTIFAIVSVIALSLPQSRFRTVLNEVLGWAFAVLCGFYCLSPVDVMPEAVLGPFGFIDDAGAIFLGYQKIKDSLKLRQMRREEDGLA